MAAFFLPDLIPGLSDPSSEESAKNSVKAEDNGDEDLLCPLREINDVRDGDILIEVVRF
jgi:hypothetical protein